MKAMLAVVVANVEVDADWHFERRRFGATPGQLRLLTEWLIALEVEEVVMESTAQYWRPVWDALERDWQPTRRARMDAGLTTGALHLAQALSNQGRARPEARFPRCRAIGQTAGGARADLELCPGRHATSVAHGHPAQITQLTRNRVQLQNRAEALLEEAHIKVSAFVSDLLGVSARRILRAITDGERDPAAIVALGSPRLRATPSSCAGRLRGLNGPPSLYRRLLAMTLEELDVLESHMQQLDEELAALLRLHQDAVQRLAAVPGLSTDSAQQIIAEVGPTATTFPTAKHLASWVGGRAWAR